MSKHNCYKATRAELAQHMKEHYERLSRETCDWCSGIPKAIDAWEREPALKDENIILRHLLEMEQEAYMEMKTQIDIAREALEAALHELTALHGLVAFDAAAPSETWTIDTSKTADMIEQALEGLKGKEEERQT